MTYFSSPYASCYHSKYEVSGFVDSLEPTGPLPPPTSIMYNAALNEIAAIMNHGPQRQSELGQINES